jgi:hypothetical protein
MACIPNDIVPYFSSQYFLALHKDVNDDDKLRPIGIRTHAHCLHSRCYGNLCPHSRICQCSLAFPIWNHNSSQHATSHPHSSSLASQIPPRLPNPRTLLQLDIVNMFNSMWWLPTWRAKQNWIKTCQPSSLSLTSSIIGQMWFGTSDLMVHGTTSSTKRVSHKDAHSVFFLPVKFYTQSSKS